MAALSHMSLIGLVLCIIIVVQADSSLEASNNIPEEKSPMSTKQLYELYKTMRQDPRLATVSNNEIISYIYRHFVYGKGRDASSNKQSGEANADRQNQKTVQAK